MSGKYDRLREMQREGNERVADKLAADLEWDRQEGKRAEATHARDQRYKELFFKDPRQRTAEEEEEIVAYRLRTQGHLSPEQLLEESQRQFGQLEWDKNIAKRGADVSDMIYGDKPGTAYGRSSADEEEL